MSRSTPQRIQITKAEEIQFATAHGLAAVRCELRGGGVVEIEARITLLAWIGNFCTRHLKAHNASRRAGQLNPMPAVALESWNIGSLTAHDGERGVALVLDERSPQEICYRVTPDVAREMAARLLAAADQCGSPSTRARAGG